MLVCSFRFRGLDFWRTVDAHSEFCSFCVYREEATELDHGHVGGLEGKFHLRETAGREAIPSSIIKLEQQLITCPSGGSYTDRSCADIYLSFYLHIHNIYTLSNT
jgi:hypothetical protein